MSRRNRRVVNQMNVVPYIDVMLVLLVIFMVTAPMLTPGVVDIPSAGKSTQALPEQPLEISLDAHGALRLQDNGKTQSLDNSVAAVQAVQAILRAQPNRPVLISAAKTLEYDKVMQLMGALQDAQIPRVGLMVNAATAP